MDLLKAMELKGKKIGDVKESGLSYPTLRGAMITKKCSARTKKHLEDWLGVDLSLEATKHRAFIDDENKKGNFVYEYRKAHELSLKEMGEMVGVTESAVSRHESDLRGIRKRIARRYATLIPGIIYSDLTKEYEPPSYSRYARQDLLKIILGKFGRVELCGGLGVSISTLNGALLTGKCSVRTKTAMDKWFGFDTKLETIPRRNFVPTPEKVGNPIYDYRAENNISSSLLAKMVGTSQCNVSLYERGKLSMEKATMAKFSKFIPYYKELLELRVD